MARISTKKDRNRKKYSYHDLRFTMKEHREVNALGKMHSLWYITDVTKGYHGTIVGRFRLKSMADVALEALNKKWKLKNKRKYVRRT